MKKYPVGRKIFGLSISSLSRHKRERLLSLLPREYRVDLKQALDQHAAYEYYFDRCVQRTKSSLSKAGFQ